MRPVSAFVRQPSALVFLITFAVYAALVPWMVKVWQRSGDEPHYLLAAHSLAFDGDFDLADNYARRDYLSFYSDYYLDPHTRSGPRGAQVLTHNLGLSLLIAPAYRLGGLVGVEYFLALLGALLAANVFALGYDLTHNWLAAAAGWIAIAFTPPLLWYVFLVYPEMPGALCIIIVLRHLLKTSDSGLSPSALPIPISRLPPPTSNLQSPTVRTQPLDSGIWLLGFSLAPLPWLSSRYLPVFGLLIAGAMWRAWRERSRPWLFVALGGLAGLGSYTLFSLWLYGSASPAAAYAGPTPLAFDATSASTRFVRGLVGWLLDNQRGLLISSPIYVVALWGSALLLRHKPLAGLGLLLPFAAALIPTASWGGFWTAWEYSARFLVAALPPLGAGAAYGLGSTRRTIAIPLTLILFGMSLWVGRAVIAQPLKGIISSPVELLEAKLDFERVVPAMAGYKYIPAGKDATIGSAGGLGWQVQAGQSGIVLRQVDIPEFPFGWYTARLPLAARDAAPDAPVAVIKIFSPRGGSYYARTIYGRDASGDLITFNFKSPLYNGWAFTPTALVSSTGQADLSIGTLSIEPESYHSLILPALWLAFIAIAGVLLSLRARMPGALEFPAGLVQPLRAALALMALASFAWSLQPQSRTYATVDLKRTVGVEVGDRAAYQGQAMRADPEAGQEAGILAASLPEIYAAGRYRLTVSLHMDSASDPGLNLAVVRVYASDAQSLSQRWEIAAADTAADGQYHRLSFDFENPRQQALTFALDYSAAAALQADAMTVEPIR